MKHCILVGEARVAYLDDGAGPPLLLLHGCPFSSFIWRHVIPLLRPHFRCIAPDLLGLGDTETPSGADWSLPAQAATVIGLLDALAIDATHVMAHDHGAATAQLIAASHQQRIRRLVLTNAEAYDNWPSLARRVGGTTHVGGWSAQPGRGAQWLRRGMSPTGASAL